MGKLVGAAYGVQMLAGWEVELTPQITHMLEKLGDDMVEDSQANYVPVVTGELSDSIYAHIVHNGVWPDLWFGASADYAAYVELGTRYMPAEPFIRPVAYKYRDLDVL